MTMALFQSLRSLRFDYPATPCILLSQTLRASPSNLKLHFASSLHETIVATKISTKPPPPPQQQQQQNSITASYLINSCGLPPEAAVLASQKIQLQSPERPDLVLALLRNYGFSKSQISKLIRKRPMFLLADPQKTLLPKLEFFHSIGVSKDNLGRTLSSDARLLTRSLENQIIPSYNFLKSVLLSDKKIVAALKRTTWIFHDHSKSLLPNVGFLSELGVPQKCIALLLTHFPEAVMQRHEQFCRIVNEVKEMGFDTQKSTFVLAVHVVSGNGNKSIWSRCVEVYKRWGWSEDMILAAFRKHPHCMILSEKKIMRNMDFFVNKMGWPSGMIAECPVVLFFSLEKRIVPRCSVIQVLLSKGLIKEDVSLTSILIPVEKCFLERFVLKYQEEVPQLMDVYQGKVDPQALKVRL